MDPGYPPQPDDKGAGYPPQAPYPTQPSTAYPAQPPAPYPQPAYAGQQPPPQAAYPTQPPAGGGYQPVTGPALTTEAPPPYFPSQQPVLQQQANNTVVVTAQPTPVVHTVYRTGNSEYALPAIIFSIAVTVCFLSLGCWHAIICSGIGIALAAVASNSASSGDMESAKQYNTASIVCTVVSLVFSILPFIVLIIWVIAISNSN